MQTSTFGTLPDGKRVDRFVLECGPVRAAVSTYGGALLSLFVPDSEGLPGDVCAGFDTLEGYLDERGYYGALIGRVANRIRGGRFRLNGRECRVTINDNGRNTLHGGPEGFDRRLWDAVPDGERLRLDYHSPDGEEGFPGNLHATVWYGIRDSALEIEYRATCDAETVVNLTSHAYFNLNAFSTNVLGHEFRFRADCYTPVDADLIPTGEIAPVRGTPFDFTVPRKLDEALWEMPEGFDHNYVFDGDADENEWRAEVRDPASGRIMRLFTSEPCMQFYTGNFLNGSRVGKNGIRYDRRHAFCLEAQKPPDAVNHPAFPPVTLAPGEVYRQKTRYAFDATTRRD